MKNIYLVGFMATGKTSVGKLLAERLERDFVDMDTLIESREKMSIDQIFKSRGEAYFRKIETDLVAELAAKSGLVVSCGGGVFVPEVNIERMKKRGIVFCLASSPEMILKRTRGSLVRPLLNVPDPLKRVAELLAARRPFYERAHHTIDADKLTVEEAAQAVLAILKSYEQS
jgi:shikimate kinase